MFARQAITGTRLPAPTASCRHPTLGPQTRQNSPRCRGLVKQGLFVDPQHGGSTDLSTNQGRHDTRDMGRAVASEEHPHFEEKRPSDTTKVDVGARSRTQTSTSSLDRELQTRRSASCRQVGRCRRLHESRNSSSPRESSDDLRHFLLSSSHQELILLVYVFEHSSFRVGS